jgi:RHS repeat-associated protein
VVVTDLKNSDVTSGSPQDFMADVLVMRDHYPFGMQMEGQTFPGSGGDYRYGFNGQERDNEVYGEGNAYTAMFWEYDPRLGRRWNLDPIYQNECSNYSVFLNNPIFFPDPMGDEIVGDLKAYITVKETAQNNFNRLSKRISSIEKKIEGHIEKGKYSERMAQRLLRLERGQWQWGEVLGELNILEASSQTYNIIRGGSKVDSREGGHTSFNPSSGHIDVVFHPGGGPLTQTLPHELKHAFQFEVGALSYEFYGSKGGELYDIEDEVECFKRSQLFGHYPNQNITTEWVINYGYENRRQGQWTMLTLDDLGGPGTLGTQLQNLVITDGKFGWIPSEIFKDWQLYYLRGSKGLPFDSTKWGKR